MIYKVIITYQDKTQGTFKCKSDITKDVIGQLSLTMFERFPSILDKRDWAQSKEQIKHFLSKRNVNVVSYIVDGRKREIKALRWFSWPEVFSRMERKQTQE